jgi:hypothetical protein
MKRFLGNFLLITAVFAAGYIEGCATVKPVTDAGKHCATVAGSATLDEVLPRVNETIGCSIADSSAIPECMLAGLKELAVEFGKDMLMCALEQIASAKFAKPGDTTAGTKQLRAKAYLEKAKEQAGLCPRPFGCATDRMASHWLTPWKPGLLWVIDGTDEAGEDAFHIEASAILWIGDHPVYEPIPLTAVCAVYYSATGVCLRDPPIEI